LSVEVASSLPVQQPFEFAVASLVVGFVGLPASPSRYSTRRLIRGWISEREACV
jgi:hypothetical protein